ncbi:MAG: glycosyltransferase family 39 protein [Nanoarchaeota archaeon]|nr:glycosyltransferase family 39 protein [Nanoarchaeota archaeon]
MANLWNRLFVPIFIILLLAFSLRFYALDIESLWIDEAFSLHIAQQPDVKQVFLETSQTEAAPPGYYVLLHYWINVFGTSEWTVRFLSVLFSTLAVLMLFLLVRLLLNGKVALLSSLFMALSMLQVEYAQEARLYALFTFLSLWSAYFFARWYLSVSRPNPQNPAQKASSTWALCCYGFSMLLALYVNYMALLLVIGFTLILFSKKTLFNNCWKMWLRAHLFIFSLSLPLLPLLFYQFQSINTGLAASLVIKGVPLIFAQLGIFFFLLPVFTLTLLIAFLVSKDRLRQLFFSVDRFFLWFVVGIGLFYLYLSIKPFIIGGIPVIRVPITNSYFLIRHSFFLVPLWYIYLVYKVDHFWSSQRKRRAVFLTILIIFFCAASLFYYYSQPTKAQWQEATNFIFMPAGAQEPFILLDKGGFSNEFLLRYYAPEPFSLLKLTWSEGRRDLQRIGDEELLAALQEKDEFWLVLARNPRTGVHFKELLDQHFTRKMSKEFYQIEVYHYAALKEVSAAAETKP